MKSTLVTINPSFQEKGFERDSLRIEQYSVVEQQAQQAISKTLSTLSPDVPEFQPPLAIIKRSYARLLTGEPLAPDDFVLSGHELLECARLADTDLGRYLVYRYKYNVFPKLKVVDAFPPCLQIEPTSICNFRCVMCYQTDSSFSHKSAGYMGHMSLDLFKSIVDQVHGKIEALTLASRGEPLLNSNLPAMLEHCRGKFLALKLNTNASLLNERIVHALLSSDLQTLVFSIDAADKPTYESIRVNGNFDKLTDNLTLFSRIREAHYSHSRLITRISGVRINESQSADSMEQTWGRIADSMAFVNYSPWEDTYNNAPNTLATPCSDLWRCMSVWWDGRVNPCDIDYKSTLSRWRMESSTISEIWTSDWYQGLREAHLNGKRSLIEPCVRCIST